MKRRSRDPRACAALVGLIMLALGCNPSEPHGTPARSTSSDQQPAATGTASAPAPTTASPEPAALARGYGQLGQMYQRMAKLYGQMGPAMTGEAQTMSQMYAQMTRMHQYMPSMMGPSYRSRMGYGMMGRGGTMGRGGMMGHGGMMGGPHMAAMMGSWASGLDRWHDQMATLNDQWAARAEKAGHADVARLHRETAEMHRQAARNIETQTKPYQPQPSEGSAEALDGAALYAVTCAACHGAQGQGVPGALPALAGNALLDGRAEPIIRIVRSGLTGPLEANGQHYNGVMPPFEGRLSSAQIAAILSYVRSAWGNHGGPITAAQVESVSS